MDKDPLTLVTETLERCLINSPAIKRVMKTNIAGRIEAFVTTRGTKEPDVLSESTLPRITLLPQGGPADLNLASNTATFELGFEVGIRSGSKNFSTDLFPLTFAIYSALSDALRDGSSELRQLTWSDRRFVMNLQLSDIRPGFRSKDGTPQGIEGTTAICTLTAYLSFAQTDLATWNQT